MQWPLPQSPTRIFKSAQVGVSAAGTAGTKGSWSTLASSIPAAGSWINIQSNSNFSLAGDRAYLLDLAIGSAGSETIVAPDLIVGYRAYRGTCFPLHIPAGATLRGRLASQQTSSNTIFFRVAIGIGEPDAGTSTPGRITAYGTVPASSGGTAVTPAGSMNSKGSWAQLTASTAAPIHALMVLVQGSTNGSTDASYAIDIAVGASGSETIVIPDHEIRASSDDYFTAMSPEFYPLSLRIPAGVRLAARCAITTGSLTTPVEVAVYGFTY